MDKTTKKKPSFNYNKENIDKRVAEFEAMSAKDQKEIKRNLVLASPLGQEINQLYGVIGEIGKFVVETEEGSEKISHEEAMGILASTSLVIGEHLDGMLDEAVSFLAFVTTTAFKFATDPDSFDPDEKASLNKVMEVLGKNEESEEGDSIKHEGSETLH